MAQEARNPELRLRMLKRVVFALFLVIGIDLLVWFNGPKVTLPPFSARTYPADQQPPPADAPLTDLSQWLAKKEAQAPALRPDLAAKVVWANPESPQRTPEALLYLHGFSASPLELSPVLEDVARARQSNLFLARLTGHGQDAKEMGEGTALEWLRDAEEGLQIASRLGERVTVVGMSTGASLAVWLATRHPEIHKLALMSANFGPKDSRSELMLGPWGVELVQGLIGPERGWEPVNPVVASRWTYRYPSKVLPQMMLVVRLARDQARIPLAMPSICYFTPKDTVLDLDAMRAFCTNLGPKSQGMVEITRANGHVLAGEAYSPESNQELMDLLQKFLEG